MTDLETWLRRERRRLSSQNDTAKAIDYSLKRWLALTRFLDDGRLCISNNAAERALRGIAVGRHNWTFAGSDEGGRRAAASQRTIRALRSITPTPHQLTGGSACSSGAPPAGSPRDQLGRYV